MQPRNLFSRTCVSFAFFACPNLLRDGDFTREPTSLLGQRERDAVRRLVLNQLYRVAGVVAGERERGRRVVAHLERLRRADQIDGQIRRADVVEVAGDLEARDGAMPVRVLLRACRDRNEDDERESTSSARPGTRLTNSLARRIPPCGRWTR
jgi:hypothetical protein